MWVAGHRLRGEMSGMVAVGRRRTKISKVMAMTGYSGEEDHFVCGMVIGH